MFPRQNQILSLSAAPSLTCLTEPSSSPFSLLGPERLTSDLLIVFPQILLPPPSILRSLPGTVNLFNPPHQVNNHPDLARSLIRLSSSRRPSDLIHGENPCVVPIFVHIVNKLTYFCYLWVRSLPPNMTDMFPTHPHHWALTLYTTGISSMCYMYIMGLLIGYRKPPHERKLHYYCRNISGSLTF